MTLLSSGLEELSLLQGPTSTQTLEEEGLPDYVNWVEAGAVRDVVDQGVCGSCWAHAGLSAVEGAHWIKNGVLPSLSVQHALDCDIASKGCDGGVMDNAMYFVKHNGGIYTEEEYPYIYQVTPGIYSFDEFFMTWCDYNTGEQLNVDGEVKLIYDVTQIHNTEP